MKDSTLLGRVWRWAALPRMSLVNISIHFQFVPFCAIFRHIHNKLQYDIVSDTAAWETERQAFSGVIRTAVAS